ncbi:unknown [Oscillibacter sp. CAG:155]|nr:unknown [Oscillibacter sp. CAG:155]
MVAQLAHPVPGIQAGPVQPGLIGAVEQTQVQQLVPGGPLHFPCSGVQHLGGDFITVQLVDQIQQLLQKGRLLRGATVYRQHGRDLREGLLQRQQLSPCIQRHLGRPAGNSQHPVPQPPEAEHFRVAAGGVPADPAQIHLRLVGGVLRHQQDLAAVVPQCPDLLQDRL